MNKRDIHDIRNVQNIHQPGDGLISLLEASQISGYTQHHLGLLCRQKKLKAERVGRQWFTKKIWVTEYLKELENSYKENNNNHYTAGAEKVSVNVSKKSEKIFEEKFLKPELAEEKFEAVETIETEEIKIPETVEVKEETISEIFYPEGFSHLEDELFKNKFSFPKIRIPKPRVSVPKFIYSKNFLKIAGIVSSAAMFFYMAYANAAFMASALKKVGGGLEQAYEQTADSLQVVPVFAEDFLIGATDKLADIYDDTEDMSNRAVNSFASDFKFAANALVSNVADIGDGLGDGFNAFASMPSKFLSLVEIPKIPNLEIPTVSLPDFRMPRFALPRFGLADIKIPSFKNLALSDFSYPDFSVYSDVLGTYIFSAKEAAVVGLRIPKTAHSVSKFVLDKSAGATSRAGYALGSAVSDFTQNISDTAKNISFNIANSIPRSFGSFFAATDNATDIANNQLAFLSGIAGNFVSKTKNNFTSFVGDVKNIAEEVKTSYSLFPKNIKDLARDWVLGDEEKESAVAIISPENSPPQKSAVVSNGTTNVTRGTSAPSSIFSDVQWLKAELASLKNSRLSVSQSGSTTRVIEKILSATDGEDYDLKLQNLNNTILAQVNAVKQELTQEILRRSNGNYSAIALTQRITQLPSPSISTPTISSPTVSGIADMETLHVSQNGSVSKNLNVGATLTVDGNLAVAGSQTFTGGSTFTATTTMNGDVALGNATSSDTVFVNARFASSLVPIADNLLDIGDGTPPAGGWLRWRTGYFGTSVGIGGTATSTGAQLTANGAYLIDSNGALSLNTTNNRQVIFGSGNIGVGTSTPYSRLSVWGNGTGATPLFELTNSASTTLASVLNDGTIYMKGNVGIGTTSPFTALGVVGTSTLQDIIPGSNLTYNLGTSALRYNAGWFGSLNIGTSTWSVLNSADGRLSVFDQASGAGNERLTILTNGNVGIGTSTPRSLLNIAGTRPHFTLTDISAGTNDKQWFLSPQGGNFYIGTSSDALNATSTYLTVLSNGNFGIGTTSPAQLLSVSGSGYFTGGLGVGVATTSAGVLETSGDIWVGGNLRVSGAGTIIGGLSSDTLTVNASINSNLIPDQNAVRDIGSPSYYWDDVYVDNLVANNISAASTTISGTQSATFTLNSDNATADTEDQDLIFFRGTVVPNALLSWKSAIDRFEFNQPLFIKDASHTAATSTLLVQGWSGQTGDIFRVASSSSETSSYLNVIAGGNVGVGTTSPFAKLSVAGSGFFNENLTAANITATGTLAATGNANFDSNITLGNATTSDITYFNSRIATHLVPTGDNISDIGDGTPPAGGWLRWRTGYFGTSVGIAGTATSTGTNLLASGAYTIDANGTLSVNTTNNRGVTFGSGNVILPFASSTAITATTASTTDLIVSAGVTFQNLSGILSSNGTSGVSARALTGTANQITVSNGDGTGGNPTFSLPSLLSLTNASTSQLSVFNRAYFGGTATSTFDSAGALTLITPLLVGSGGTGQTSFSSSQLLYGAGSGAVQSVATTSLAIGSEFTHSGTLGSLVGGSAGTLTLTTNGTALTKLAQIGANSILGNLTGSTADVTAIATSSLFTWTGTGDVVRATSPTLITPALGTPSALTLTNATGLLPAGINLTKGNFLVGNDAGVAQATSTIFISSTGSVGIGTTTPGALLNIASTLPRMYLSDTDFATNGHWFLENNAGVFSLGTTSSALAVSDTRALSITNTGNVGIGTTTPSNLLSVYSSSAATMGFTGGNGKDVWSMGYDVTNNRFAIASSSDITSNVRMVIDNTGNVGIGTTGPGAKLDVVTTSAASYPLQIRGNIDSDGGYTGISFGDDSGSESLLKARIHVEGTSGWILPDMHFLLNSDSTSANATMADAKLSILNNGNVGIGTTGPASALDVASGRIRVTGSTAPSSGAGLELGYVTSVGTIIAYDRTTPGYKPISIGGSTLSLYGANNSAGIDVDTTGNVGIGTTGPGAKLTVSSGTGGENLRLIGTGTTGDASLSYLTFYDSNGTTNRGAVGDASGANDDFYVRAETGWLRLGDSSSDSVMVLNNGNVGIGTTTPSNLLSVYSSSAATAGFSGGAGKGVWSLGYDVSNNYFAIASSSSITSNVKMVINNDGNVGIGTTTPIGVLQVQNGGTNTNVQSATANFVGAPYNNGVIGIFDTTTLAAGTGGGINFGGYYSGTTHTEFAAIRGSKENANGGEYGGALRMFTRVAGGAMTEWMRIANNGNVGIGTTTPSNLLSVYSSSAATMGFTGGNGKDVWSMGYDVTNNRFAIASSSDITSNVRMVIDNTGNVGIGTTSPVATLGVNGLMYIGGAGTSTIQNNLYVQGTLRATNSYVGDLVFGNEMRFTEPSDSALALLNSTGENIFEINSNGGMRLGSTATSSLADFQIMGHCVTGDTLLPIRRRRKAKNKRKTGDLDEYDYFLLPIKDVLPGDEVLSLNEAEDIFEYRRINALLDMGEQEVFELTTASGRVIRTTSEHPYLVKL